MSDFLSRASLAGAVDLSGLRKQEPVAKSPVANSDQEAVVKVPDLVAIGTESNLKNFLSVSEKVALVIDFFASDLDQSVQLSLKLEKLVRAINGKILLIRVDTKTSLNVAQAFAVKEVPSVVALLKGQPVPLFEGDQSEETIQAVLERLLQVAQENGISGTLDVAGVPGEQPVQELPPRHRAAFEAIDSGNYAEAVAQYEAALKESPADSMAVAGLAQAKLLLRTKDIDFDRVLSSSAEDFDSCVLKADAYVAVGSTAEGYQTILTRFAIADKDEREKLRKHLLELFAISPPDAPELAAARRSLAALLY